MLNISLCDSKISINSKSCMTFTTDVQNVRCLQRHKRGGTWAYAICTLFTPYHHGAPAHRARETEGLELLICETPDFIPRSLWPPNSPDLNPVDYTVWVVLQERVYREKSWTVEELQQRITDEWECLDQHVIDNAVKQWHKCLRACVLQMANILNISCECCTTFAVNREFYCHINCNKQMLCIKVKLVLCLLTW